MTWKEMTPEQRDALVAEKVMGWTPKPCDLEEAGGELTIYSSGDACCPRCGVYEHINSFEHGTIQPPHYSTSMDAAWQVVEKVNERGEDGYGVYARFIDELQKIVGSDLFFDLFYCEPGGNHLTPERICLAALRAVGYEEL